MEDSHTLSVVIIGIGCGGLTALAILLTIYCIRRRLIHNGFMNESSHYTLSEEEYHKYLMFRRARRKNRVRKMYRLSGVRVTQNPMLYKNTREMGVPGPASK